MQANVSTCMVESTVSTLQEYSSCIVLHENSFVQQHNISVSLDTHVLTLSVISVAAPDAIRISATAV